MPSPARIGWLRSLQGRLFPHCPAAAPGCALTPSEERFGGNASSPLAATMLSDGDGGSVKFVHFLRNGSWTIPIPTGTWTMHTLECRAMTETAHPVSASGGVTIEVATEAPPSSSSWPSAGVNIVLVRNLSTSSES